MMAGEVGIFLEACLLGFLLGACYDVFRILRMAFPNGRVLIFLEDVLYFALAAVASFSFIVLANGGLLRAFVLIGELLGTILYFFTLSLLIMGAARQILRVVHAILRFIYRLTLLPLLRLGQWIFKKLRRATGFFRNRVKFSFFIAKKHLKPPDDIVYNVPISPQSLVSVPESECGDHASASERKGRKKPWQRRKPKNH